MTSTRLSRRALLKCGAGMLAMASGMRSVFAVGAATPTIKTPLTLALPRHATDAHCHVFDPERFPYNDARTFTPPSATASQLRTLHEAMGTERTVLVTSTVYGTDNRVTLDAISQLGADRTRGVALIDANTSRPTLEDLNAGGIRAVRVFLGLTANVDPQAAARHLRDTTAQIAGLPWHLQTYARLPVLEALKRQLAEVPVPLVLDHFAGLDAAAGPDQPGFATVIELLRSGRIYVKISGPYYSSRDTPDFANIAPFAKALVAANPERILWGSDWPHPSSAPVAGRKPTDLAPAQDIDDARGLNRLGEWVPDAGMRKLILVDNPARLFDWT